MPGRDGKGPQGAGPGTGGRRGNCFVNTGAATATGDLRGAGRGYAPRGGGRGRAYGAGRGFGANQGADWDTVLHNKAAMLERELEEVRRCIKDNEAKQA